jgi:FkbM family methyltransferase
MEEGDIVFDVGANIGAFTLFASIRGCGMVYAFEPIPANFELLMENVKANRLTRVKAINKAVQDRSRVAKMILFPNEMEGCRFPSPNLDGAVSGSADVISVNCISITEAMQLFSIDRIDFLKMDCEGEEFSILFSLEKAVLDGIRAIALEYHDNVGKGNVADLAGYLTGVGFRACIKEDPLRPMLGYLYAWK